MSKNSNFKMPIQLYWYGVFSVEYCFFKEIFLICSLSLSKLWNYVRKIDIQVRSSPHILFFLLVLYQPEFSKSRIYSLYGIFWQYHQNEFILKWRRFWVKNHYNHGHHIVAKAEFFFFYPKVSPLAQLLNVGEVKNAGANPQPYNIKSKGGIANWLFFIFLVINCFFGHIFLAWLSRFLKKNEKGIGSMYDYKGFLKNAEEHVSNQRETLGRFQTCT